MADKTDIPSVEETNARFGAPVPPHDQPGWRPPVAPSVLETPEDAPPVGTSGKTTPVEPETEEAKQLRIAKEEERNARRRARRQAQRESKNK